MSRPVTPLLWAAVLWTAVDPLIVVVRNRKGQAVTSRTRRGERTLTLKSRFDNRGRLLSAQVTLATGKQAQTARVVVEDNRARVTRTDLPERTLDCPPGVIVTSAPDWTDAFLAVRRFKRDGPARQAFAGLWVHPAREPLAPRFELTRTGSDAIRKDDRPVRLDRFELVLRAGSRYTAWATSKGQLVRLFPSGKPQQGIVLDGWEHATKSLAGK